MGTREIIACSLIATFVIDCMIWSGFAWHKGQRLKLRRRGIKRYER